MASPGAPCMDGLSAARWTMRRAQAASAFAETEGGPFLGHEEAKRMFSIRSWHCQNFLSATRACHR